MSEAADTMNAGERLYLEYYARHVRDGAPAWHQLDAIKRHSWSAWAAKGGRCQTGYILRNRIGLEARQ